MKFNDPEARFLTKSLDDIQLSHRNYLEGYFTSVVSMILYRTVPGREQSLALTKLEESLMWACKALKSTTGEESS